MSLEGLNNVMNNLNKEIKGLNNRTGKGLLKAGLMVQRDSQKKVPVDTANLKGSAYTEEIHKDNVEVGYTADYAVIVHEDMEAHHDNGQAKFLEEALNENKGKILKTISGEAKVD